MTYTDPTPPPFAAVPAAPSWETCDHCQAPLAERQRYCVVCGARRPHADDPAARYFVESARRARAVAAPPAAAAGADGAAARLRFALVVALLPLVAALGIVVGRGSGGDRQLVDALRAQKAPVVNVIGGGAGVGATDAGSSSAGSGSAKVGRADPVNGDVIAKTRYGSARRLTGASVTPQEVQQSRAALQHIVDSKGRAYVDQQRNLPDQIVIP